MSNYPQSLLFTAGLPKAWLRELSGKEEHRIAGTDLAEAIKLIDSLLVNGHRDGFNAQALTAADRDRILAAIYLQTYGDPIKGTLTCTKCEALFDMDFSLANLRDHMHQPQSLPTISQLENGNYLFENGIEMRLPTGEDELALRGCAEDELATKLLERCLVGGKIDDAKPDDLEKLAEIAPMLQAELGSQCPECGHEMQVQFDIQIYLLQSLMQDQEGLNWEVHRLASAYGWRLKEILGLPRSMRKRYSKLIEFERYTGLS